jgi:hypothetical protein
MVELRLPSVAHRLAFGQYRMPIMLMHAHVAVCLTDKYISGMRDVVFVMLAPGQAVLIEERGQCKKFRAVG